MELISDHFPGERNIASKVKAIVKTVTVCWAFRIRKNVRRKIVVKYKM